MSDQQFMRQFEACTLPPECFHHADHLRMAFLYVCHYPILEAIQRFSEALRRFACAQGKPDRYHQTITWAYMFLIAERRERLDRGNNWEEFRSHNPDLLNWKPDILARYYHEETLNSSLARQIFVFPDKLFVAPAVQ